MKTTPSAFLVSILLAALNLKAGEEIKPGPSAWNFVDFFPQTFTYLYLGKTSEGGFRFKPFGGTAEAWTPEVTLKTGETSDGGYLTVIRSVGSGVEVRSAPANERIRLEIKDKISASTIFLGFYPKIQHSTDRPFFIEVGKRFNFPNSETEFIIIEAASESIKVTHADGSSAAPMTFERLARTQLPNKGRRATASPSPAP